MNLPTTNFLVITILSITIFLSYSSVRANETYTFAPLSTASSVRFNNENWFTEPHPQVQSLTFHTDGSMSGLTVTGISFTQYTIPNDFGIKIQRFEMQDHYHYIINGEIAYTAEELSTKLITAYNI